jgi:hypothetical protein
MIRILINRKFRFLFVVSFSDRKGFTNTSKMTQRIHFKATWTGRLDDLDCHLHPNTDDGPTWASVDYIIDCQSKSATVMPKVTWTSIGPGDS